MTYKELKKLKVKYLREGAKLGYKRALKESIDSDNFERQKSKTCFLKSSIDDEFVKIIQSNIFNTLRKMQRAEDGSFDANEFVNNAIISRGLITKLSRGYDADVLSTEEVISIVIDILSSKHIRFNSDGDINDPQSIEEVASFYTEYLLEELYDRQY